MYRFTYSTCILLYLKVLRVDSTSIEDPEYIVSHQFKIYNKNTILVVHVKMRNRQVHLMLTFHCFFFQIYSFPFILFLLIFMSFTLIL